MNDFTSLVDCSRNRVVLTVNVDAEHRGPMTESFLLQKYAPLAVEGEQEAVTLLHKMLTQNCVPLAIVIHLRENSNDDGLLLSSWVRAHKNDPSIQMFPLVLAISWSPWQFDKERLSLHRIVNAYSGRMVIAVKNEIQNWLQTSYDTA